MMNTISTPGGRRPTFEELCRRIEALPQSVTGQILEAGILTTMSRPGVSYEWTLQGVFDALGDFNARRGSGGWWFLREMEIRFPGDRLAVPDLAGWRVDRTPKLPLENPMVVVPDWCCEVLSPTTAREDRVLKLPLYADTGVRSVWLVDPVLRTLEVFQTIDGRATLVGGARDEETMAAAPFDAPIAVGAWWMPT